MRQNLSDREYESKLYTTAAHTFGAMLNRSHSTSRRARNMRIDHVTFLFKSPRRYELPHRLDEWDLTLDCAN